MDRLNDLRLFVDAAQLGSFSAAGRKQGLSPAAASACIQRIEATLGVKLFERTTRQLRLTDEGELYRQYCRQALDTLLEAEALLQAGRERVSGTVRLSAPSDLGRHRLLDFLADFQQQYPEVQYALSLTDSTANLVSEELDLAIRYGQPVDSSLVARPLADNHRVVCVAPALLARLGRPEHPQQLAEQPALVQVTAAGPVNEWRYRELGVARAVRLQHYQECNDGEAIRQWALRGQGFAYKSRLDVLDDLAAGRLVTVLDDYFTEQAPLHVLFHRNRFQPPRIRKLVDYLQQRFVELAPS